MRTREVRLTRQTSKTSHELSSAKENSLFEAENYRDHPERLSPVPELCVQEPDVPSKCVGSAQEDDQFVGGGGDQVGLAIAIEVGRDALGKVGGASTFTA